MKKIICLLICVASLMSIIALAACSSPKENTQNNNQADKPKEDYLSGLDFGGKQIRFAIAAAKAGDYSNYGWVGCDVDEANGDTVVDAVYNRNRIVEEKLNVDIEVAIATDGTLRETIITTLQSGDDEYDILWGWPANDVYLCLDNYLLDINQLDDSISYLDPEASWWATEYTKHYQFNDEIYWLSGPLSLIYAGGASCIFVNSRLYNSHFEQTYGNIYDFVKEGKWTIDEMAKMSSVVYQDLDGNDKLSDEDVFGARFHNSWSIMETLIGCGLECVSRSADGSLNFEVIHTNEKYITIVEGVYTLLSSTPGLSAEKGNWADYDLFIDGKQLFMYGQLDSMRTLRDMPDDFYIIPNPKFDINQTEYRAAMVDWSQPMGIAYTCSCIDAATATLELMAYTNETMVLPLYFEQALKFKYSRDDNTAEMVDLIHNSVYTDFALVWEEYIWGDLWIRYPGFDKNITSAIRKTGSGWIARFNELSEKFDKLGTV